jgi:hypothetical protein
MTAFSAAHIIGATEGDGSEMRQSGFPPGVHAR